MTTEKQRRAFISYSRINKEFASKLSKGLRDGGYSIWFDLFDIPTGARWDDEVEKALRECSIFMVILTPASIASENVKDEIGYAIDHGKRILPVLLENCDVPLRLRRFQYVDFTTKSFEEGFASAKDLLRDLIDEASVPLPAKTPSVAASTGQKPEAEAERKLQEEAERLAVQKAEDAQLIKAKSETERRAKEESIRLAAQKAEREAKAEMPPAEMKAEPVSIATTQKKPIPMGLVIGAVVVVVLVIAGIGISAFGSYNSSTNDPSSYDVAVVADPATDTPADPITVTPAPVDATIYSDDFSDPNNNNWGDVSPSYFNNDKFYAVLADDQTAFQPSLLVDLSQFGPDLWTTVHATYVSDGGAGLYCRYQNAGFYLFLVDFSTMTGQILYYDGSTYESLVDQTITQTSGYDLAAGCIGNSLDFYVNGENLHAENGALPDIGTVGIWAQSSNSSGTTVEFDDFWVGHN